MVSSAPKMSTSLGSAPKATRLQTTKRNKAAPAAPPGDYAACVTVTRTVLTKLVDGLCAPLSTAVAGAMRFVTNVLLLLPLPTLHLINGTSFAFRYEIS